MKNLNRLYPHLLAVIGFIIISVVYFYPLLQGKKLYQSDIAQYTGMAKEQNDFRKLNGEELYWTDSAFGGMPTYQLGAHYPYNYIKKIDSVFRFLPRPADYLFLYFAGFYLLLIVLKIDPLKAFFGALAFGFSTYLIIIFGAGHNSKAHAIAYMPIVIAGIILVFKRKYLTGGILTALAVALELNANHLQMTFYLLFLILFIGIYYSVQFVKDKDYKHFLTSSVILVFAALLAVGTNATNLMATSEFTNFSIRSKSELNFNPDGSSKTSNSSMDYTYITEYSYGIGESLNLVFPMLFGGGSHENVGKGSVMYDYAVSIGASPSQAEEFVSHTPTYWGDQPIVEAPAYIGIVVFFLAILCLFSDRRKIKYVFLCGAIFSLLLSWGKNFHILTNFFINYIPLYDKFRAVSSIQVILELCIPVLAMMGLQSFFQLEKDAQKKSLYGSLIVMFSLIGILLVCKGLFSFTSISDQGYMESENGSAYLNSLISQRKEMYAADLWRAALFISFSAGILWLSVKNKISITTATILVGIIMVSDLFLIDKKYVNNENFVNSSIMEAPFEATGADNYILKDTSHYRVYDPQGRLQGRTSYFHKSVGGYSAVRPRKADQVFIYQVEPKLSEIIGSLNQENLLLGKSVPVLDMLNVKYILLQTKEGENIPVTNSYANGPSWFISKVKTVDTASEEMKLLGSFDSKNEVIINRTKFADAVNQTNYIVDSSANIILKKYKPDNLQYISNNKNKGFAVFSEMYYANGWKAFVDDKPVSYFEVDYLLRGLEIPAGKHKIDFVFDPSVIKKGSNIALFSFIALLILSALGIYFTINRNVKISKMNSNDTDSSI